tara:strand:+ start:2496 stop:2933 length:438 start_codon:yes stop_codon:yes gene_type:complete
MEKTHTEQDKMSRNLSSDITNNSKNLTNKVGGIFREVGKEVSMYGIAALVLGYGVVGYSNDVRAQPVCGSYQSVSESLKKSYSEEPVSMGITSGGGVVEVYESKKDNTWTLVITQPNGMSCLIAAGQDWEDLSQNDVVKEKGLEI